MDVCYQTIYDLAISYPMSEQGPLFHQSLQDLVQDFDMFIFLATSQLEHFEKIKSQIEKQENILPEEARRELLADFETTSQRYHSLIHQLTEAITTCEQNKTRQHFDALLVLKKNILRQLRSLFSTGAGLMTSTDWQSPSSDSSFLSQAGRETGIIHSGENDYKRDLHAEASWYQKQFVQEYHDAVFGLPVQGLLTSSGMSAMTTVATALLPECGPEDKIMVGENSYFQNKYVLRQLFGGKITWFNEMDTSAILDNVAKYHPKILFLDTLCNTPLIPVPDITTLIQALAQNIKEKMYLVLDNTPLSSTLQPLSYLPTLSHIHLIRIESLVKFHQFGFDQITGGMILAQGSTARKMWYARMHLGTNIAHTSALTLPKPNRKKLEQRFTRFERNAQILSQALEEHVRGLTWTPIANILYPGLASHPAYAWTKSHPFHGAFFTIAFKFGFRHVLVYDAFLALLLSKAKKKNVDLNAGTSFGFDTTRAYLSARYAESRDGSPFVRIAVGTETLFEMETLKQLFIETVDAFSLSFKLPQFLNHSS
ncbi:hypothetical protein EXS71_00260 [Candidatus Uhrbacteria bacterium]|nr:hypothetical protein [Candidatus Uhrbacteria bacterium]